MFVNDKLFNFILTEIGESKITVIKAIKESFLRGMDFSLYEYVAIAFYQSYVAYKCKVQDFSSYNEQFSNKLNIKKNELQALYKSNQIVVWEAVKKLFSSCGLNLMIPNQKPNGPWRYVQYPLSQQLLSKQKIYEYEEKINNIKKSKLSNRDNLTFEEFCLRVFDPSFQINISNFIVNTFTKKEEQILSEFAKRTVYEIYLNFTKKFIQTPKGTLIKKRQIKEAFSNSDKSDENEKKALNIRIKDNSFDLYDKEFLLELKALKLEGILYFEECENYEGIWLQDKNPANNEVTGVLINKNFLDKLYPDYISLECIKKDMIYKKGNYFFIVLSSNGLALFENIVIPSKAEKIELEFGIKNEKGEYISGLLPLLILPSKSNCLLIDYVEYPFPLHNIFDLNILKFTSGCHIIKTNLTKEEKIYISNTHLQTESKKWGWKTEKDEGLVSVPFNNSFYSGLNYFGPEEYFKIKKEEEQKEMRNFNKMRIYETIKHKIFQRFDRF